MKNGAAIAWRDALARLPTPAGKRFVAMFGHGSLVLEMYAPHGNDPQTPHTRDALYVVVAGSGIFVCGDEHHAFAAGDALFAPAGAIHRFEEFGEDLAVWVMFYGPEGGEAASA